jgi:predicted site-specific integrase-resolvase
MSKAPKRRRTTPHPSVLDTLSMQLMDDVVALVKKQDLDSVVDLRDVGSLTRMSMKLAQELVSATGKEKKVAVVAILTTILQNAKTYFPGETDDEIIEIAIPLLPDLVEIIYSTAPQLYNSRKHTKKGHGCFP